MDVNWIGPPCQAAVCGKIWPSGHCPPAPGSNVQSIVIELNSLSSGATSPLRCASSRAPGSSRVATGGAAKALSGAGGLVARATASPSFASPRAVVVAAPAIRFVAGASPVAANGDEAVAGLEPAAGSGPAAGCSNNTIAAPAQAPATNPI